MTGVNAGTITSSTTVPAFRRTKFLRTSGIFKFTPRNSQVAIFAARWCLCPAPCSCWAKAGWGWWDGEVQKRLILSSTITISGRGTNGLSFFVAFGCRTRLKERCLYLLCAKSRFPMYEVVRVRLESKPVSYSWFPAQVGPQVSNPGYSIGADRLANVVAG
jgi:hypothetical protein